MLIRIALVHLTISFSRTHPVGLCVLLFDGSCLFVFVFTCICLFLLLLFPLSLSLCLTLSLCPTLSLCLALCISLCLCVSLYISVSVCLSLFSVSFCLVAYASMDFSVLRCHNVCSQSPSFCRGRPNSGPQGIYMLRARHGRYSVVLLLSLLWRFYRNGHSMVWRFDGESKVKRRSSPDHFPIIYRQSAPSTTANTPEHETAV